VTVVGIRLRRRPPPPPPQLYLHPRLFLLALVQVPLLRLLLQTFKEANWAKTSFIFCGRYHNTFPVYLQTSPRYNPLNEGRSIISIPTRKNFQYMQCLIKLIMCILY
jgi:hypothetical protein